MCTPAQINKQQSPSVTLNKARTSLLWPPCGSSKLSFVALCCAIYVERQGLYLLRQSVGLTWLYPSETISLCFRHAGKRSQSGHGRKRYTCIVLGLLDASQAIGTHVSLASCLCAHCNQGASFGRLRKRHGAPPVIYAIHDAAVESSRATSSMSPRASPTSRPVTINPITAAPG